MNRCRASVVFACVVVAAAAALAATPKMLSVQVRSGQVRASPSFLGRVVAVFAYGDRVEARQETGAWTRVGLPGGGDGWMHVSALTPKRIVLRAGDADANEAATDEEIALAGKGFNEQVEAEYRARHQELDFAPIDRMEENAIPTERLVAFLREGELKPQGAER